MHNRRGALGCVAVGENWRAAAGVTVATQKGVRRGPFGGCLLRSTESERRRQLLQRLCRAADQLACARGAAWRA